MPGIVKIGYTDLTPDLRAKDLFTTGVPTEFVVEYEVDVYDYAKEIEKSIFDELEDVRISRKDVKNKSKREFFQISIEHAIEAIDYCIRCFIGLKGISLASNKKRYLERYNIVMPQISTDIIKAKTQKAHDKFIESYEKMASAANANHETYIFLPNIKDVYLLENINTKFCVAVVKAETRDKLPEWIWKDD